MLACIHGGAVGFHHLVTQIGTKTLRRQLVGVKFAGSRVRANFLVHQWLGQAWRVLLVMTQLAKTSDIDHYVLTKFHAELKCQLGCEHHGFRVIAIHVQYGRLHHFHYVCTECAGAHIAGVRSGETDLVIDDDVYRTASGVTTGLGQCQCFLVHTLTAESRVTMDQNWQHLLAHRITTTVHPGAHRAFDHGVHNFKVGRIEGQRQVNGAARSAHI